MNKPDKKTDKEKDQQTHFEFGLRVFCNACDQVHTIEAEVGDIVSMPCCIGEVRRLAGYFSGGYKTHFQVYRTIIGEGMAGDFLSRWHHPECPCTSWNMHPKDPIDPDLQKIIKKFEGHIRVTPYLEEDGTLIPD